MPRLPAALILVALAVLLGAGGARAQELGPGPEAAPRPSAPVDPLTAAPLQRAALLALPSLYRVRLTASVEALRTSDGRRIPLPDPARAVDELGGAFAVADGGYLVTAAHVADPSPRRIAASAYRARLAHLGRPVSAAAANAWAAANDARPEGVSAELTVRQADAGAGARDSRVYWPRVVVTDATVDLTVLRVPARHAPALALTGTSGMGTSVALLGFGPEPGLGGSAQDDLRPAVRAGVIGLTGSDPETLPGAGLSEVLTEVRQGDSGGPVIDRDAGVRGLLLFQRRDGGGLMLRAAEIRAVLTRAGITPGPNLAADRFRAAMAAFWNLRFDDAARGFAATLAAFPRHTLARQLSARAAVLGRAHVRLAGARHVQGFLLAFGVLAAAGAGACAAALVAGARAARPARPRR